MNEELQSTNEELQTMNDELRNRSVDLNSANDFLESVFGSLRWAVVVLDREFRVQVWNQRATDLWVSAPMRRKGPTSWVSTSACPWESCVIPSAMHWPGKDGNS